MRHARLAMVLLLGCGARSELDAVAPSDASIPDAKPVDAGKDAPHEASVDAGVDAIADAAPDVAPDAETPSLTLSIIGVGTDLVSPADQGIYPDGELDGHFASTAVGAFDALILVTTFNGQPANGQQWDTLVLQDPVPPLGFSFSLGEYTWVLGVWENGKRVSDPACRVSLGPGTHVLELVGSNSGYFNPGVEYKLYGRVNGTWIWSNVAKWQ